MNRRDARVLAFQLTYEMVMNGSYNALSEEEYLADADAASREYVMSVIGGVTEHREELKAVISKYARGYDFDRIYKVDLAVLYVACYELMYTDTPKAVIANEAVEIAKTYSDTQSYSFINGILASVIKEVANG